MSTEHQSLASAKTAPVKRGPQKAPRPDLRKSKSDGRKPSIRPVDPPVPKGAPVGESGAVTPRTVIIFSDLSAWALAYRHKVPKSDAKTVQYCEDHGIPIRQTETGFVNPHAIAHVCRDEALRLIFISEGRGKTSMTVLDWFGGGRNLSFCPAFGPFAKTEVNGVLVPSKEALSIVYTMGPKTAISGDNGRTMTSCKVDLGDSRYDVVFLQDIYHHGTTPESAFTPRGALEIIERHAKLEKIYVVNRTFFGIAGADDFGNGKEEQVFYRNARGLIVSSPDPTSAAYACHPDTDWLAEYRTLDGVDLCPLHRVGPYNLVRLSKTLSGAQALGDQLRTEPVFQLMDLYASSWKKWVLKGFGINSLPEMAREYIGVGGNEVAVHIPTWIVLSSKFAVKSPNGQILDSLISCVERSFSKDAQCVALRNRFPSVYTRIFQGTVAACLHGERRKFGSGLSLLRGHNADTEVVLTHARASTNPNKTGWGWKEYGMTALGVGAVVALTAHPATRRWLAKASSVASAAQAVGAISAYFYGGEPVLPGSFISSKHPVVGALAEEALAYATPNLYRAGVAVELVSNAHQNPLGAVATLGMHVISSELRNFGVEGRICAAVIHVGWNAVATKTRVMSRSEKFLESYKQGELLDGVSSVWEPLPGGLKLPAYVTKISAPPADFRGTIQVSVDHVPVTVEQAFELLDSDTFTNGTYPILITHRLLHQPANCAKNLLAAIVHRLHADPFLKNPFTEKERHRNWDRMARSIVDNGLLWNFPEKVVEMEEVYAMMGKKGERIRRAHDNIVAGRTLAYKKTINLKWNETLSVTKDMDGVLTMKPRAIQNLEPEVHALMAPFARVLNFVMHACFDGQIHTFEGHAIRLVFASGSTGQQLNQVGNWLSDGIPTFVASGDDSVVSFGGLHPEFDFGEADQSAFDHTQDDGPNKIFQGYVQRALGFPREFTELAYEACSSGYTSRKGRFFARGECGTQMPTGITTTTTYNSLATLTMWLFWLLNQDKTIETVGSMLGFKVKFSGAQNLRDVTFLKGWWLRTIEGPVVWYPLPSAVLKLGKVITDPLDITSFTRRGKRTRRSDKEAVEMCAMALANSYSAITSDYPIFGPFLEVLRRLGKVSPSALRRMEESQKPTATGGTLIPDEAVQAIFMRYGITAEDVSRVERLLGQINSLPAYVEDPVFDLLAVVDY